jgi:hypothetical protein
MPYSKCPICGAITHLMIGDVQRWYAEHHPGVPVGSLVPGKCLDCWPKLEAGMRVVVRLSNAGQPQVPSDAHGVVQQVLSATEHGSIYLVQLESGNERYFTRAELRTAGAEEA